MVVKKARYMTARERYRAILRREETDRIPVMFWHPRTSTFAAWRKQGLSQEQQDNWTQWIGTDTLTGIGKLDCGPLPEFEETTLEVKGNLRIWIDNMGAKRMDAINQPTAGFQTRRYLEFPIKSPEDFEEMKKRYDPHSPGRVTIGKGAAALAQEFAEPSFELQSTSCNNTDMPVIIELPGLYWRARDWCGFEGLSIMFHDQPNLVHEMMEFWTWFLIELCKEPFSQHKVDQVILGEDMAYKTASMISPAHIRAFMLPLYKKLHTFFREHGVDCLTMDSDGHNSQILEVMYPEGLTGISPVEIAANNDPAVYLAKYPKLHLYGGIDKRELRFDKDRTRAEIAKRFRTAWEYGGYIPSVDHATPPDVPLRNFLYMVELAKGFARGENIDTYEPPCELEQQLGPIEEMFDHRKAIAGAYGQEEAD